MAIVDHLVNNAGISPVCMFEEIPDITKFVQAMVIHFPCMNFSLRYLKVSK